MMYHEPFLVRVIVIASSSSTEVLDELALRRLLQIFLQHTSQRKRCLTTKSLEVLPVWHLIMMWKVALE
ncbi:unnamed protein product [Arctia plantaginis]|uniref:Uncharacterized protein n=1 Tax=Arctia plantaginis TaxID=874455 RepID=A0A8S0ZCD6_ARCPL|nr:unnamed protein product [Arctia plantaginis]